MVKSYLKYALEDTFGVINSSSSRAIAFLEADIIATACDDAVKVWNCRTGEAILSLEPKESDVFIPSLITCLLVGAGGKVIHVGYANGILRSFDLPNGYQKNVNLERIEERVDLTGHKSAITCLAEGPSGLLASGSKDTHICIWRPATDSGLFKLRGHRNEVTSLLFLNQTQPDTLSYLFSCSKDCLVHIWDLSSQTCIFTISDLTTELWAIAINQKKTRMYIRSSDLVHCYGLDQEKCSELQPIRLSRSKDKCQSILLLYDGQDDESGVMLLTAGASLEFYRVYSESMARKRAKRRVKRVMEKRRGRVNKLRELASQAGRELSGDFASLEDEIKALEGVLWGYQQVACSGGDEEAGAGEQDLHTSDEVAYLISLNVGSSLTSISSLGDKILLGHSNNTVSVWKVPLALLDGEKDELISQCQRLYLFDNMGHIDPIRQLSVSPDDSKIMSLSKSYLKIWNPNSRKVTRSIECGSEGVKAGFFLAGSMHVIIGSSKGSIALVNLESCEVQELWSERRVEINAMCEEPSHAGFAVGYKDGEVMGFELGEMDGVIGVRKVREACVAEEPVDMEFSLNGRFLAVALQDSTIQVLYADSFRMFLKLYGHKLPVVGISISSDCALLASSSLDKTAKIWGMDFGDIRRSLAGGGKLTWLPDTHYLLVACTDSTIRLYDCDTYELISHLQSSLRPTKSLACSTNGHFFLTASDVAIRMFRRTEEQIFLSEEREREELIAMENEVVREDVELAIPVEREVVVGRATRRTIESVRRTERLMEAIDEAEAYRITLSDHETSPSNTNPPQPPPNLFNRTPDEHVLITISNINQNILNEVILALPFLYAEKILQYIANGLDRYCEELEKGNEMLHSMEVSCRVAIIILQVYYKQFSSIGDERPLLDRLRRAIPVVVNHEMDRMLGNREALRYLRGVMGSELRITNEN